MPRTLLTIPVGHESGLTSTSLGLVRGLDRIGVDVGFYKPLARQPGEERSTALIRLTTPLRPPDSLPGEYLEERLSAGALNDLMEEVVARAAPVFDAHDVVIIEGVNPSTTQLYSGRVNGAMAKALDADVILVTSAGDDEPQHVAEMLAISTDQYRVGEQVRVIGCVVNRLPGGDAEAVKQLKSALEGHHLSLVGAVPYEAGLTWPRVLDIGREIGARVLHEGDMERRVKGIAICAQAIPGALRWIREGQLVLVPGDRHDVLLAGCLAVLNGMQLAGVLLTVGVEPDPAIWHIARKARETGLPFLIVDDLTYEAGMLLHDLKPEVPPDDRDRANLVMRHFADSLDQSFLQGLAAPDHQRRLSPAAFRHQLVEMARSADKRIVLPEGTEPRTLQAAVRCAERGISRCVLLGDPDEVHNAADGLGLVLSDSIDVVDPATVAEQFVPRLMELRKHKGVTEDVARDALADPIMVGTMMLREGYVDGLVAGAVHTTAYTVRPAMQVIRTAPGSRLVSSVFFMCLPDQVVIYGDCAVNPDPDAEGLADIALQSAGSARAFGIEPRVAMISFSTGTSGAGADVEKVAEATRIARQRDPGLMIDGPLQYDAAAIASVGRSKAPHSPVAGRATVFIFPDLNTGNTTYKAVQRSADVVSIGPMLQGLAKPVNDLSRGALIEDIMYTIALTAIQAHTD